MKQILTKTKQKLALKGTATCFLEHKIDQYLSKDEKYGRNFIKRV